MNPFDRVYRGWLRFCLELRRAWRWHHALMTDNDSYARVLVQGVVRALWQESVERMLGVLIRAAGELLIILRRDGLNPGGTF
jgi:hypothetical protein